MSIKETLADNRSQTFPFPTSLAVAVGDLLFWDPALVAKPANARADKGSKALNQADFRTIFLGVSAEQRLSTETSTGNDSRRLVIVDGVFDCDCASSTFEVGDLIGIDRDGTPLNMNQQVIKVAIPALAIGKVTKREPVAVTKVRCRLTSSVMFSHLFDANRSIGDFQGQGINAAADAALVLTVDSAPFRNDDANGGPRRHAAGRGPIGRPVLLDHEPRLEPVLPEHQDGRRRVRRHRRPGRDVHHRLRRHQLEGGQYRVGGRWQHPNPVEPGGQQDGPTTPSW